MARTTTQLRDVVLAEGGFDSSLWSTAAVGWLNEAHKTLLAKARWQIADTFSLGTTTAGTATYTLSDRAVLVEYLEIDDERFYPASEEQVDGLHDETFDGDSDTRVFAVIGNATGAAKQVRVYPTPDTSSLAITAKTSLVPADLDTSGSNPACPEDFEGPLIAGAIAIGKRRVEQRPDLAVAFQQVFETDGVVELRKRRVGRSAGPVQVAIRGIHFR